MVIAGASSLLGAELKSLLEESKFADWDFRLVDEEDAAGTLTEAAGEATVIQPVEEGSFDKAKCIFFAGSADFTQANLEVAQRSGAILVDLSGLSMAFVNTFVWYPGREKLKGQDFPAGAKLTAVPSAAAEGVARLSLALQAFGLEHLTATVLQPVSASGKPGIQELETQTTQLLSFQPPGKDVFDVQVAFNSLDRFGPARQARSQATRLTLRGEIAACLRGQSVLPAVDLIHVPTFYGVTFSACAKLSDGSDKEKIAEACRQQGFTILDEWGKGPDNISVAGEAAIQLSKAHSDSLQPSSWWFWGAADNIRLPAANAVKLAERLL